MTERNIPKSEYDKMLADIRTLAFGDILNHKQKILTITGLIDSNASDFITNQEKIKKQPDYLNCAQKIIEIWPIILKRPLKQIAMQPSWIGRQEALLTQKGTINFVKNTHKTKLALLKPQETFNCPENILLLWIITETQKRLMCLIEYDSGVSISNEINQYNHEIQSNIDKLQQKLNMIGKHAVFQVLKLPNQMPLPTQRMLGTIGYADIYRAFQQKITLPEQDNPTIQKGFKQFKQLFNGSLKKDWQIYEIWCFLQLYRGFKDMAGFTLNIPIIDYLEIVDNTLQFKESTELKMTRTHDDINIEIRLCYQYKFKNSELTPDFLINIRVNNRSWFSFIFDAKWRDYSALTNSLEYDIYSTAYQKYRQRLSQEVANINIKSVFILHSDDNSKYEHWNGSSLFNWLPQTKKYDLSDIQGHQIGAICLKPNHTLSNKLSKIIYMILLYHIGNEGNEKEGNEEQKVQQFCPQCGTKGKKSTGTNGKECPNCKLKWWINNCTQNKTHRIIKMGNNQSFHNPTNRQGLFQCPECGDSALGL